MANSTSDAEHVSTPTDPEKEGHAPVVEQVAADGSFDIDAHDLPKGYFLSPSFIGTMLAVGLAFVGVRNHFHNIFCRSMLTAIGSWHVLSRCTSTQYH